MSYIVVLNPLILSGPDSSGASLGFPAVAQPRPLWPAS